MNKVANFPRHYNNAYQSRRLTEHQKRSIPRAVRKIAILYGLPLATAFVTTALAGFTLEGSNDR